MPTQNKFTDSLYDPSEFTITYELVPGQGSGGRRLEKLLKFVALASEDGRIKALSITDNPGGHPALAPIAIGSDVKLHGVEPLLHFSLKDKNRTQVESHLFLYHRQNFNNLLVLGGDFPQEAYYGQARPVFDLGSVQALQLMRDMEEGTYRSSTNAKKQSFDPITFNRGCVVSPFKTTEPEQVWQYAKLLLKIRAGAHFVITQLGYDICKFEELMRFLTQSNVEIPVLGNVFIPSLTVARHMSNGKVPGVIFPDSLLQQIELESHDGNNEARLIRAAKLICVLHGLGYAGVHLGGNNLDFDDIKFVLDTAEEIGSNWEQYRKDVHFPVKDSWYLYPSDIPGACGRERIPIKPGRLSHTPVVHKYMHMLFFNPGTLISNLFGRFCLFCAKTRQWTAFLRNIESGIKSFIFYCRMCGDCTLPESTYICPQSGCPKKLLNGPCGGSRNQACEVYPDRYCFWVRVYNRLEQSTTIDELGSMPYLPPKNWALDQTSSWINFYAGRDHKKIVFPGNKQ